MLDYYTVLNTENTIEGKLKRYIKFINSIEKLGKRKFDYKECHHIIPRCINKMVKPEEVSNYYDKGFKKGMMKKKR